MTLLRDSVLKPTLKDKKRYIFVKMLCFDDERLNIESVISSIWRKSYEYGGYRFVALSNLNIIKALYFEHKSIFVITVRPKYVEDIRFILMQINEIDGKKVSLFIKGVSGTIKSGKKKYVLEEG